MKALANRVGSPVWPVWAGCLLMSVLGCDGRSDLAPVTIRVDAAASIAHVIEALADPIRRELGIQLQINAAASGTLAQQITHGDRADLFISADPLWMDRLASQGLIDPATETNLAGNRLVLVGPAGFQMHPQSLAELVQSDYWPIALGDPAYVPAGRYALQALSAHGLDAGSELKCAEAPNVRAALMFVVSGHCPTGLVYSSDAASTDSVEVLLTIDPNDHDPIRYLAAVVEGAPHREQALRVLDWLNSDEARSAFAKAGFAMAER